MDLIALVVAGFFAMNIGANRPAVSMGAAYGAGAITRRVALPLVAIGVFIGAWGGGRVVHTLGLGLLSSTASDMQTVLLVLGAAAGTLFMANLLAIPLSTSQVTVGAIVGVGIAGGSLHVARVIVIVLGWAVVPVLAFVTAYGLGKLIQAPLERRLSTIGMSHRMLSAIRLFLIGSGTYEAVAAGTNSVASAAGPLMGAGFLSTVHAIGFSGFFVALGALVLGGRVLETNAKRITDLTPIGGCCVSFASGTLVILASLLGLPVPLTQATTTAIVGVGYARGGRRALTGLTVRRVAQVWILSPIVSLVLTYGMATVFLEGYAGAPSRTLGVAALLGMAVAAAIYAGRKKFVTRRPAVAMLAADAPRSSGGVDR